MCMSIFLCLYLLLTLFLSLFLSFSFSFAPRRSRANLEEAKDSDGSSYAIAWSRFLWRTFIRDSSRSTAEEAAEERAFSAAWTFFSAIDARASACVDAKTADASARASCSTFACKKVICLRAHAREASASSFLSVMASSD